MFAVSSDQIEILSRFSKRSMIEFPLLSDPEARTIDAWGIRNKESTGLLPHPTLFILDKNGVVQGKLAYDGYKQRHTSKDLIEAVGQLSANKKSAQP